MPRTDSDLDDSFVQAQQRKLQKLKADLEASNRERAVESAGASQAVAGQAREFEDDAQHLSEAELNGQLGESALRRLGAIDRALAKIAEGTYGKSDASGKVIDRARLIAIPEAVYTKDEQEAKDGSA